jgi:hypothetical protein
LSRCLVALQLALAAALPAALAFAPPAEGRMILVPLWPQAADRLVARSAAAGARLVGHGPLPRSLVVSGRRAALAPAMAAGVLILAAPPAGCGRARA